MKKILIVVYTENKLNTTLGLQRYAYYTTDSSIKPGDHFKSSRDGRWVQVLEVRDAISTTLHGKPLKQIEKMENSKTNMISGIREKYMSQYIPEKVPGAKMSADGSICVLIGNEYIGMKGEELTTYPEEFVMDFPVYSIVKLQDQVKPGEIVITGKGSFGKVLSKNTDGSLKILSFTGYTHNKKEVKDFMLGKATVRVLVNMFNSGEGFNPILFAAMSGDKMDLKTLALLQMMPGMGDNTSNPILSNPMMMALMMKGDGEGGDSLLEVMMLSSMMGGQNPFAPNSTKDYVSESTKTEGELFKELLKDDPELREAFAKAVSKKTKKGGEA